MRVLDECDSRPSLTVTGKYETCSNIDVLARIRNIFINFDFKELEVIMITKQLDLQKELWCSL